MELCEVELRNTAGEWVYSQLPIFQGFRSREQWVTRTVVREFQYPSYDEGKITYRTGKFTVEEV